MFYLAALFAHWVADFPVQGIGYRWMGKKHESMLHLFNHAFSYFVAFFLVFGIVTSFINGHPTMDAVTMYWVFLNAVAHGIIDFWTSRGTNKCWYRSKVGQMEYANINHTEFSQPCKPIQKWVGAFFSVIGFDQMLHMMFMFWSAQTMGLF